MHSPLSREYGEDLRVRVENISGRPDPLLLEALAFSEGRLLSIHPFTDFNGRVTRLFVREILRRLELPPVDLVPADQPGEIIYLSALRNANKNDWTGLVNIWQQRLEQFRDSEI